MGSIIGAVVIIGFGIIVALGGIGMLDLKQIPQGWFSLVSLVVLLSAIQVFGIDTLKALQKFKGG